MDLLPKQFALAIAPQHRVLVLGSIRSGKTEAVTAIATMRCAAIENYKFLNCSISSDQAAIMFKGLLVRIDSSPRLARLVSSTTKKPYPIINFQSGGSMEFRPIGFQAELIRGHEFDWVNFDEGGYEDDEFTINTLEGRTLGMRDPRRGIPRGGLFTVTTSPTHASWLRDRALKGSPPTNRHLTLVMTIFENIHLPADEVAALVVDYPPELVEQELYARLPELGGGWFASEHIYAAENRSLNDLLDEEIRDSSKVFHSSWGLTRYELPWLPGHRYVMAGDPGTGSVPKRNAGCIAVLDVTQRPFTLAYFDWITGNGSIMPWLQSFKYAVEKYQPHIKGVDATGPQKMIDELAFESIGLSVDGLNFQHDKFGYLNALRMQLNRHEIQWPFVKGIRDQLQAYQEDDKKIPQDIVCTLAMAAHLSRFVYQESDIPQGRSRRSVRIRGAARSI